MSDTSNNKYLAKIIAFYFPQFHAIPENDKWWGKGFTDWDNVKRGTPAFKNHYQPKRPANGNYYDLSLLDTIKWQVDLAKSYGISGFCHYHYWFDGKQLLETPTNKFIQTKELDLPFCLAWANETNGTVKTTIFSSNKHTFRQLKNGSNISRT